jgi:hypothetical protein
MFYAIWLRLWGILILHRCIDSNPVLLSRKYFFQVRLRGAEITFLDFSKRVKMVTIYNSFFSNHDFIYKILQVCGKWKGAGAVIRNFCSGSGRQFNFGSSTLDSLAPQQCSMLPSLFIYRILLVRVIRGVNVCPTDYESCLQHWLDVPRIIICAEWCCIQYQYAKERSWPVVGRG